MGHNYGKVTAHSWLFIIEIMINPTREDLIYFVCVLLVIFISITIATRKEISGSDSQGNLENIAVFSAWEGLNGIWE